MDDQTKLFYNCLVLVTALQTPTSQRNSSSHTDAGWRRFLNDLCWLCDTDTGGKTVVSLAVEQLQHRKLRIWLASATPSRTILAQILLQHGSYAKLTPKSKTLRYYYLQRMQGVLLCSMIAAGNIV